MTAEPTGHLVWSPDALEQRRPDGVMRVLPAPAHDPREVAGHGEPALTPPFAIRLPIAGIAP